MATGAVEPKLFPFVHQHQKTAYCRGLHGTTITCINVLSKSILLPVFTQRDSVEVAGCCDPFERSKLMKDLGSSDVFLVTTQFALEILLGL